MIEAIVEVFEGSKQQQKEVWQFRSVKFDIDPTFNYLPWEKVTAVCHGIEDRKGNPGEEGALVVTSVRLIWYMLSNKEVNLTVGYDAISRLEKKVTFTLGGKNKRFLNLKATRGTSRYEFQFCSGDDNVHLVYDLILRYYKYTVGNCRAASDSLNYRKIQLRASLVSKSGDLLLMPGEEVISKYPVVKNFMDGRSSVGGLMITNVRVVWVARDASTNFSVPWVCFSKVRVRENNETGTLAIQAQDKYGEMEFVLHSANLNQLETEVKRLFETYKIKPLLGYDLSQLTAESSEAIPKQFNEDVEIVETEVNLVPRKRTRNSYMIGDKTESEANIDMIEFSQELGLAIEALPEGVTVSNLWQIFKT